MEKVVMIPRFRRHLLRVRCTAHFRIFCPLPCMNIQQSKRPGPPTASRRAPPSSAEGGKSFLVAECSIRILLGESGPSHFHLTLLNSASFSHPSVLLYTSSSVCSNSCPRTHVPCQPSRECTQNPQDWYTLHIRYRLAITDLL